MIPAIKIEVEDRKRETVTTATPPHHRYASLAENSYLTTNAPFTYGNASMSHANRVSRGLNPSLSAAQVVKHVPIAAPTGNLSKNVKYLNYQEVNKDRPIDPSRDIELVNFQNREQQKSVQFSPNTATVGDQKIPLLSAPNHALVNTRNKRSIMKSPEDDAAAIEQKQVDKASSPVANDVTESLKPFLLDIKNKLDKNECPKKCIKNALSNANFTNGLLQTLADIDEEVKIDIRNAENKYTRRCWICCDVCLKLSDRSIRIMLAVLLLLTSVVLLTPLRNHIPNIITFGASTVAAAANASATAAVIGSETTIDEVKNFKNLIVENNSLSVEDDANVVKALDRESPPFVVDLLNPVYKNRNNSSKYNRTIVANVISNDGDNFNLLNATLTATNLNRALNQSSLGESLSIGSDGAAAVAAGRNATVRPTKKTTTTQKPLQPQNRINNESWNAKGEGK